MPENLAASLRLLLVTDDRLLAAPDPVEQCLAAVRGGASAVQLRLKDVADPIFIGLARELRRALTVPLFINDRLDIALAVGADGVHLGPDDLGVAAARRIAPRGFVIGASVGSEREVERARDADYWGIGPLNRTATKHDAGSPLGVGGVHALIARAGRRPCVAIGGVRPEDVADVMGAGAAGVAVVSGILGAADVELAARRYASPVIRGYP